MISWSTVLLGQYCGPCNFSFTLSGVEVKAKARLEGRGRVKSGQVGQGDVAAGRRGTVGLERLRAGLGGEGRGRESAHDTAPEGEGLRTAARLHAVAPAAAAAAHHLHAVPNGPRCLETHGQRWHSPRGRNLDNGPPLWQGGDALNRTPK